MSTIGLSRASRVELVVKNLLAGRGNLRAEVQSLGREDPLKKSMAIRSSIHPGESSRTEEPGGLRSTGSQRVRHS